MAQHSHSGLNTTLQLKKESLRMYTSHSTVKLRNHYKLDNSKSRTVCIAMKPHWFSSRAFGESTGCCPCWEHGCVSVSVWELADSLNQNQGEVDLSLCQKIKKSLVLWQFLQRRRKRKRDFWPSDPLPAEDEFWSLKEIWYQNEPQIDEKSKDDGKEGPFQSFSDRGGCPHLAEPHGLIR